MDNDYTRITWPEVRKGDVLFHENGDRMTVKGVRERITVAGLSLSATTWQKFGFFPYRRKPELPTVPGAYLDKDGGLCVLDNSGSVHCWWDFSDVDTPCYTRDEISHRAPFTRLVPMPTEGQVRKALFEADVKARLSVSDATDAVMALLRGGDND